jgi:hypothetical protein
MSASATITLPEAVLAELMKEAIIRRIERDYDMYSDRRTNDEVLKDLVQKSTNGNGDLLKYIHEMLRGDTHGIFGQFTIEIP